MSSFDGFNVQVDSSFLLPNCCISAVRQRARAAITEPCDVVLVAAEVLVFHLCLEGAVPMVDDLHSRDCHIGALQDRANADSLYEPVLYLPYDFIVLHEACLPSKCRFSSFAV